MRLKFIALSLVAFMAMGSMAQSEDHAILALGSPAPDFSLPGVDGRTYSLKNFADAKVLVVIFTCNHCPTAQAYEGRIHQLVNDFRSRGVAFVAINPNHPESVRFDELGYTDLDDTFESMKIRAADRHFNLPYLDDGATEAVALRYGPAATPHVFIFDKGRHLCFQGRIDDSEREDLVQHKDTRNAIEALLADRQPEVTETKVFGCSIKWADKAEGNRQWMEKVRNEPVTIETADASALQKLRTDSGGKIRVINVWATWCGPCVAEFDDLVETNLHFRHRDFELVTVAAQFPDEKAKVLKFLEKHHASTRNLIFGETDKYKLIEAIDPKWDGALPHTLVIDADGKVLYSETGELDFLKLRRAIVPALNRLAPWPGLSPVK